MPAGTRYFLGLDLGQSQDHSALAVLERPLVSGNEPLSRRRPVHLLRHLHRFPLQTPYPEVVQAVLQLWRTPTLAGAILVVDETGVGRAVVDHLRDSLRGRVCGQLVPVTITAGHTASVGEQGGFHLPKRELIGVLQVLLQTRRLRIPQTLPAAELLLRELQTFKVKITAARNETFAAWREGDHDDLILAVALAAWLAEKTLPSPVAPPNPYPPTTRLTRR